MSKTTRRRFLAIAGIGTAAAAGAALPLAAKVAAARGETVAVRAVGGVPSLPLPTYATYVLDGYVDPARRSGVLTRTVFAGPPEAMSGVALPGLSRTINVVDVVADGARLHVRGEIADRSQLLRGESARMELWIDRADRTVRARSGDADLRLALIR